MSSSFWCATCKITLRSKAATPPKSVKCPRCGSVIESGGRPTTGNSSAAMDVTPTPLPVNTTESAPSSQHELMRSVVAAFRGKAVKRRPKYSYLIGLFLGALGLALLFLAYVGLVCAGIYFLWLYVSSYVPQTFAEKQADRLEIAKHIGIILAWLLMLYALIAPFFSFERRKRRGRRIEFVEAPGLHAFTKALCDTIHAPVPAEIRLISDPIVVASYRGGLLGLFTRQLQLEIGAPLISGLEIQQLAGLMAHEAGFFSQDVGSGFSSFVRVITNWFNKAAVISESSTEQFSEREANSTIFETIVRWTNLIAAIIGQLVLRLVLWLSQLMSIYILRRQVFDADLYQSEVAGSETFYQSILRLRLLQYGYEQAKTLLSERKLPTPLQPSFTAWVLQETQQIDPETKHELTAQLTAEKSGLLVAQPSDSERIATVKQHPQPGLFSFTAPAKSLCPNLDAIAVEISPKYYRRLVKDVTKKPAAS